MNAAKYQKARFVREMLVEEANHSLNMQVVLSELPDEELQMLEHVASKCRSARVPLNDYETVTFVVDWEEQLM
jgi:hypothetical protein